MHFIYPIVSDSQALKEVQAQILDLGADWALISYGLRPHDASTIVSQLALSMADLKACAHFCPESDVTKGYLIHDEGGRYIP